jgi:hypothetical protein
MKQMNMVEFGRNSKFYNLKDIVNVKDFPLLIMKGFLSTIDVYSSKVLLQVKNFTNFIYFILDFFFHIWLIIF